MADAGHDQLARSVSACLLDGRSGRMTGSAKDSGKPPQSSDVRRRLRIMARHCSPIRFWNRGPNLPGLCLLSPPAGSDQSSPSEATSPLVRIGRYAIRSMPGKGTSSILYEDSQQALEQSEKTLREAESLQHPSTMRLTLIFSTCLHQLHRDVDRTLSAASRAIELSEEHGFRDEESGTRQHKEAL